jgi:hypothetical protein
MEEVSTVDERITHLKETFDLTENCARALILAECGHSSSGIAQSLDVTSSTARKYLSELEEKIGTGVTETLPKSERFATFPGEEPPEEPEYSGDYVALTLNRGPPLKEIDPKQMTVKVDV